jgi:hypothetical protein
MPQVMIDGVYTVSSLLRNQGIRHVVVGGVAVACNGYPRTTMNIDVAVGDCAFEYRDKVTFMKAGLPMKYAGIRIHYVAPTNPFEKAMLEQYLVMPAHGDLPPVLPIGPLVVMKLIAGRHKDRADVIELFKRRTVTSIEEIEKFVKVNLPSQIEVLNELITCAANERAEEGIEIP